MIIVEINSTNKIKLPYQVILFIWKLFSNVLPTCQMLRTRHLQKNSECCLCQQDEEDIDNLFIKYPFTIVIWFESNLIIIIENIQSHNIRIWLFEMIQRIIHNTQPYPKIMCHIPVVLYAI